MPPEEGKMSGVKVGVLDLRDALLVLALLVRGEGLAERLELPGPIRWRVGVENPYVKECVFRIGPEVAHSQVTARFLLAVGGLVLEPLASELLQRRLDFDVVITVL